MTPRQADRLLWVLLAATLLVAVVVAVGCQAPRPGYGTRAAVTR